MKKKIYCISILATTCCFWPATSFAKKPNIVIIYMDDMGFGDIETYGMNGVPTPNLNKFASQGIRFTNFEAAQPISTASRAALLTGCYPNRVGMGGVLLWGDRYALNPKEETLAKLLKDNGYYTGAFGKWHLGNQPPYFPTSYGFDEFVGIPYSHDMWPIDYDGYTRITDPKIRKSHNPTLKIYKGFTPIDSIVNIDGTAKLTTYFTEQAVSFIKRNREKPFFLYLAHPLPHVPLAVSDKFKGKSKRGLFGDVIMEIDWSIGQVMKTLDKYGLAKNTIVIFASDNGPWLTFGNNAGSTNGLREGKQTTYEGGNRVPFMIRWPGHFQAGRVCGELMTNMDILPTIIKATNSKLPKNRIDGINYLPFLEGKTNIVPRKVMYYYYINMAKPRTERNDLEAVRYDNWKLVFPHTYLSVDVDGGIGKDGYPGKPKILSTQMALYDLSHDQGERYNIISLYPEITQKLLKIADEARSDLGDDLTSTPGKNIRPAITY